jgi:hypothetical protein
LQFMASASNGNVLLCDDWTQFDDAVLDTKLVVRCPFFFGASAHTCVPITKTPAGGAAVAAPSNQAVVQPAAVSAKASAPRALGAESASTEGGEEEADEIERLLNKGRGAPAEVDFLWLRVLAVAAGSRVSEASDCVSLPDRRSSPR